MRSPDGRCPTNVWDCTHRRSLFSRKIFVQILCLNLYRHHASLYSSCGCNGTTEPRNGKPNALTYAGRRKGRCSKMELVQSSELGTHQRCFSFLCLLRKRQMETICGRPRVNSTNMNCATNFSTWALQWHKSIRSYTARVNNASGTQRRCNKAAQLDIYTA